MSFPFLPFQPLLLPLLKLANYTMVEILIPMYSTFEPHSRTVDIRFGVVRLVVRAQERYTLGGSGGTLPQKNVEI